MMCAAWQLGLPSGSESKSKFIRTGAREEIHELDSHLLKAADHLAVLITARCRYNYAMKGNVGQDGWARLDTTENFV